MTADKTHRVVGLIVLVPPKPIDRYNSRMLQRPGHLGFEDKLFLMTWIRRMLGQDFFEGDDPVQLLIPCQIDCPQTPTGVQLCTAIAHPGDNSISRWRCFRRCIADTHHRGTRHDVRRRRVVSHMGRIIVTGVGIRARIEQFRRHVRIIRLQRIGGQQTLVIGGAQLTSGYSRLGEALTQATMVKVPVITFLPRWSA